MNVFECEIYVICSVNWGYVTVDRFIITVFIIYIILTPLTLDNT